MSIKTLYKVIDSSSDIVIRCALCFESMTFGHYYHKHALQEHFLKNRKECVFCMGLKSWPHGQKMKRENVRHVLECLKGFVARRKEDDRLPDYDLFKGVTCASASISSRCPTTCMTVAKTLRMWDFTIQCLKNPTCGHVV
ncbi:hypothetical protein TNCV_4570151 [Trichonephila clavipes]|nr:hypothetical protein TNCV_4570151 [Trichonephila clavipes]